MSSIPTVEAVEAYINDVRAGLADVPDDDRADLLDDVAAHVREIADEFGADALRERLGLPEEFTAELRASAGYARAPDAAGGESARSLVQRGLARVRARIDTEANRALWTRLEPGWFVVRGVFAGYAVLAFAGADAGLIPRAGESHLLGLAVLVAGAVASFKLGDRRSPAQPTWIKRTRIGAEVALVVFAVAYASTSNSRVVYYDSGSPVVESDSCLRDGEHRPIGNLYAFDPSGQLIPQFFLTDQAGRPIQNLCPDQVMVNDLPVETDYARDVNGSAVYGVFPRRQTASKHQPDGVQMTKEPLVPPAVVFPQLAPSTNQATTTTTTQPAP